MLLGSCRLPCGPSRSGYREQGKVVVIPFSISGQCEFKPESAFRSKEDVRKDLPATWVSRLGQI